MNIPQEIPRSNVRHEESLVKMLPRIHPKALGIAMGVVAAAGMFLITAFHILVRPDVFPPLLLKQYFPGYDSTWIGAVVGAAWTFGVVFVAGWVGGVVHNFTVNVWWLLVNARAELTRERDILDQIR